MPSGAKKRKALKKKKEQEAVGDSTGNKGFNGNEEHGSQNEGESDGNLSSPGSQGNGESWTRDPSPSPLSGMGKDTIKEKTEDADFTQEDVIAVGRGTDHEQNGVDKSPNSFPENVTHNSRKAASQESGGTSSNLEIAPAVDYVKPVDSSVSKAVVSDKNEQVESSTDSVSVKQKYDEKEERPRLTEAKEGNSPGSSAETSKEIKRVKESEVPECSEEKSLLPSGPPVVRTSWLSCCGLFDVMAGSER
ncbi:hypothetical protein EUTSA_v10017155mg [Eutrema salsugineum]|uniref:Uncharacterized protein n=1 Tax=Eutrema salsugineum TaxID=72664 RepID=V4MAB1_EUTSA|nr:uncharacterized protein LOC18027002 [Eutrema salsugineum]XP_006410575.1 uncharacterized protein LOC18027002 [Eutrema salsugineum]ESQ52027.1 hypothetical protein EUTSA_v10017155mg [Eutrema salsugineum]ESQ52028.1 hypothetical protein EUTSA_v10017155mg [Eutrema salsugineum]